MVAIIGFTKTEWTNIRLNRTNPIKIRDRYQTPTMTQINRCKLFRSRIMDILMRDSQMLIRVGVPWDNWIIQRSVACIKTSRITTFPNHSIIMVDIIAPKHKWAKASTTPRKRCHHRPYNHKPPFSNRTEASQEMMVDWSTLLPQKTKTQETATSNNFKMTISIRLIINLHRCHSWWNWVSHLWLPSSH